MRVKLRQLIAGAQGVFQAGEVIEVDAASGKALIEGGYAEAVSGSLDSEANYETATREAPETTAGKGGAKRKAG